MKKRLTAIMVVFLLLTAATSVFAAASFSDFQVTLNGNYPLLTWRMSSEAGVTDFIIERSTDGVTFYDIASFSTPEGAGYTYRFTDSDVFKQTTKIFYYRIRVMQNDTVLLFSDVRNIQVSQTYVQQTWGSLKALFR